MSRRLRFLLAASGLLCTKGLINNSHDHLTYRGRISTASTTRIQPRHSSPVPNWGDIPTTKEGECSSFVRATSSQLGQRVATLGAAATVFASVLLCPVTVTVDLNVNNNDNDNARVVHIHQSSASAAMTENQQFVSDVWWAVTAQYFDRSFNGMGEDGWRAKKKEAVQAVADTGPEDEKVVTEAIKTMLSALGDPYTRYLPREKFEALTAYATGGSAGIGVQLLENPRTNNVVVMATTTGGPAKAAGIHEGDIILEVDGESMEGATAEVVAAKCRGDPGGKVEVLIRRGDEEGVRVKTERMSLTRAKVKVNPVEASTFVSSSGKKIGLLKVPSFSTETVSQMVDGLRLVSNGNGSGNSVDAIAIDLRGNVGGYMPAGVDVAKLFLPARAHIIAEVDKAGAIQSFDADGIGAETAIPVYLLIDQRTASAAEIFVAALQDNRRAVVVGTTNTFGKGRIQNVQPLGNGSGVAVTKARYVTPSGRDLHGVGIKPNKEPAKCETEDSALTCLVDIV
jgi:carboxyl-terminal processing protease